MNLIKRIGNALIKSWKFATNKIMEIASGTRIVTARLVDITVGKFMDRDSEANARLSQNPTTGALAIGTVVAIPVLFAGMSLVGIAAKVVASLAITTVLASVMASVIFAQGAIALIAGVVTSKFITCLALVGFAGIAVEVGGRYIEVFDEAAPVEAVPMHS